MNRRNLKILAGLCGSVALLLWLGAYFVFTHETLRERQDWADEARISTSTNGNIVGRIMLDSHNQIVTNDEIMLSDSNRFEVDRLVDDAMRGSAIRAGARSQVDHWAARFASISFLFLLLLFITAPQRPKI